MRQDRELERIQRVVRLARLALELAVEEVD
jgi:hypothetical protein